MRTALLLFVAAANILSAPALGDAVCTSFGCVHVNEGGYVAIVDGDAGNPDPADGYVFVGENGAVCFSDAGSPGDPWGTVTCVELP